MFSLTYRPRPSDPVAPAVSLRAALLSMVVFLTCATSSIFAATTSIQTPLAAPEFAAVEDDLLPAADRSSHHLDVLVSNEQAGGESVAEQVFQGEFVSARSLAAFARNAKPFGVMVSGVFNPLFTPGGLDTAGPLGLRGRGLSNTISALHESGGKTHDLWNGVGGLGSGGGNHAMATKRVSADAGGQFWAHSASGDADDIFSQSVAGASAADNPGNASVLIPLPAAAWSGLMIIGGAGLFAGIRRAFRKS